MVAIIKTGTSIRGIMHYNENKVTEGEAKLILASGFAGEIEQMTFQNKLQRFQHLAELRPSVKTNALHISLNFDSSENISSSKMQEIAIAYMERIGFGDQPYLVYRHNDAGHQHLHIATISINKDGDPIKTHNLGRDLSEPARKAIEKEFNLIVAESKKEILEPKIKTADLEKAKYGKTSTKRQISNVVSAIIANYKFTSLAELNAVLKEFNVIADRGLEESEMFNKKGLVYSMIGNDGEKIGVPIKASAFYHRPTLRNLEVKFERNKEKRKPYKQKLIERLNKVLFKYERVSKSSLLTELQNQGIKLVLRQNDQGKIYGATYIDYQNKTVFNGSDLGKLYSANAISRQLDVGDQLRSFLKPNMPQRSYLYSPIIKQTDKYLPNPTPSTFLADLLGKMETDFTTMPKRKKRKRRRGLTI